MIQGIDSTGSAVAAPAILPIAGDGSRIEIRCSSPGTSACPDAWVWAPDDSVLIGHAGEESGAADAFVVADPATGEVTAATVSGKGAPAWQRLASAAP